MQFLLWFMKFDETVNSFLCFFFQTSPITTKQMQDFKTEMPLQQYMGTVEIQNVAQIPFHFSVKTLIPKNIVDIMT